MKTIQKEMTKQKTWKKINGVGISYIKPTFVY